jgi:predicted metalloprotease
MGMGNMIGLLPMLLGRRGGSKWLILVVLAVAVWFFMRGGGGPSQPGTAPGGTADRRLEDEQAQFIAFVFDDVQETWRKKLAERGGSYQPAHLILFTGSIDSGCGYGTSAVGPFYCPRDQRAYIDLSFYDDLHRRLGAPGDFAQAYVIAHEVGHHVQNLLGTSDQVQAAQQRARGEAEANQMSVRLELQADCYAGVWAHSTGQRQLLEKGDLEEALGAAAAVGDDRLQKKSRGQVQPESFTHGSAAERASWFRRGYESGDPGACDTFSASP